MKKLIMSLLATSLAFPASVFAESARIETIKQETQAERTEVAQDLIADMNEADAKLNDLNTKLDEIKKNRDTQKVVALYSAAIATVSGAMGFLLTRKSISHNPVEVRASVGTLFGILTTMTAVTSADNIHEAMLSEDKISDLQIEIFGVKRKIQLIKEQINVGK